MLDKPVDEKKVQTLSPIRWIKLVIVYLFIPVLLFVCAGDLRWWQAWVYRLLVFTAGIVGRLWGERRHPGLMAERVRFGKDTNEKPWDKILAPLMAVSVGFPLVIVRGWITALDGHQSSRYGSISSAYF